MHRTKKLLFCTGYSSYMFLLSLTCIFLYTNYVIKILRSTSYFQLVLSVENVVKHGSSCLICLDELFIQLSFNFIYRLSSSIHHVISWFACLYVCLVSLDIPALHLLWSNYDYGSEIKPKYCSSFLHCSNWLLGLHTANAPTVQAAVKLYCPSETE